MDFVTDQAFAAQLAEDIGPAGVRLVAEAFRSDLARLRAVLAAASARGDVAGFGRAAHGLAGAAAAVGATRLERACRAAMDAQAGAGLPAMLATIDACADEAQRDVAHMLAMFGETA